MYFLLVLDDTDTQTSTPFLKSRGESQLLSVSKTFTEKEIKYETEEETLGHKVPNSTD